MKKAEFIARYGEEAYQRWLEQKKQWREKNPDYAKQYYEKNPDYFKRYRQENKEKIAEYSKQYHQENKEKRKDYDKRYYQDNKEKIAERIKQYYQDNKEKLLNYNKQYNQTLFRRASSACCSYRRNDKRYTRGECTLTPEWIVDNIFTKTCLYCGEKDWHKLGCDRIDNSKPHTPDNVVCCCHNCNLKRQQTGFEKFLYKSWRKRFAGN